MIQPPSANNALGTLSSLYGVKQAQQNLQTGAYQQQAVQADAQQAQQKNQELQKAQAVALQGASSGAYDDGNGGIDRQKMANDILKVAPTYGQSQVTSLLSQANEVMSNRKAHQDLTVAQKGEMGATMGSLAADPQVDNTKVIDAVEKLRAAHPNDAEYSRLLTSQMMHLPNTGDPKVLQDYLGRWAAASTGTPQVTPNQIDTGTQIQPGAQNRFTGAQTAAGPPINKQNVVATPAGPLGVVTGAKGTVSPLTTTGAGPNLNTTHAQQENVQGMAGDDRTRYAQISQEGTNATTGAQLADQVSQLADQVRTGKLSKDWNDRLAVLQQHDPTVTARQMLSKYAAQLKTMATSGATTDASRSQIDEGMPNPESMAPDAVKEASQYVGGIFRMRGARQDHADQYTKNNGNSIGIRDADDAFMKAADPTVFAYNALPAGQARQEFAKAHGINTPEKAAAFKARLNQINHYSGGQ